MTDKKLIESIITYCKGNWLHHRHIRYNDQGQCIYLALRFEKLKEIPDEMLELKHLEELNLSCNELTFIPKELNYIKDLRIYGNPIFESKDKVELLFNKSLYS